jgi:TolA-binding protein
MRSPGVRLLSIGLAAFLACSPVLAAQEAASEEFARRKYDMGLTFLRDQKFDEALKEFQSTVDSYPKSRVADAALLRIAEYRLDVAGDAAAAQAAVDRLIKEYEKSDSGPMAYVLAGRIIMSKGRAPADVDSALAKYVRVPGLFPGSDAVPASIFYAAEALRVTHRDDEAVLRFRQVSTDYPQSAWAPRALLGEARCLVLSGKTTRAMELLQRVRQRFPGTPEAATAVAWNTILYRLYLRAPAKPAYEYVAAKSIAGSAGKLKDIQALGVGTNGTVYAASRTSVLLFDPAGRPAPALPANDARAILFDHSGRPVLVCKEGILPPGAGALALSVPKPDGSPRALDDIAGAVLTSTGDLLVTDKNAKNLARFSASGKHIGLFAAAFAQRLTIDGTDRVTALDQDGNGVTLIEHDGRIRTKIPARGAGYEFDRPVDVAVDALGHLYVLDRNRAAVFVFTQADQPKLITAFSIAAKSPGSFRKAVCFALDEAGRLYIYDDDVERIQVYQ